MATVAGLQPLRAYVEPGARIPLSMPTASGRAILAFSPQDVIEELLSKRLQKFTPKTIVDPAKLRSVLEEIKRRGVSVVHGENQQQLSAVAAPIMIRSAGASVRLRCQASRRGALRARRWRRSSSWGNGKRRRSTN